MIDTIKLTLDQTMFAIIRPEDFQKDINSKANGFFKYVLNPTKGELLRGTYKPRITITKRFNCAGRFEPTLTIELSLPKLQFCNNFVELTDNDFESIIERLSTVLKEMGIMIYKNKLENAPVSAIHYSKNIVLDDGLTPYILINKIKDSNIRMSADVDRTSFRNDGYSYKWHANMYEVAFYDKVNDLKKSKTSPKRSGEKDNEIQLNLFEEIKKNDRLEVLRMEVRLNNRTKIRSLFKTLNITSDLSFKDLFKQDYSKTVLLHYIRELESNRPVILDYSAHDAKSLLTDLIINNPRLKPHKVFELFGIRQALEHYSERELKGIFNPKNYHIWYRLMKSTKEIVVPNQQSPLSIIKEKINEFKPISTLDFDKLMLNNDKRR